MLTTLFSTIALTALTPSLAPPVADPPYRIDAKIEVTGTGSREVDPEDLSIHLDWMVEEVSVGYRVRPTVALEMPDGVARLFERPLYRKGLQTVALPLDHTDETSTYTTHYRFNPPNKVSMRSAATEWDMVGLSRKQVEKRTDRSAGRTKDGFLLEIHGLPESHSSRPKLSFQYDSARVERGARSVHLRASLVATDFELTIEGYEVTESLRWEPAYDTISHSKLVATVEEVEEPARPADSDPPRGLSEAHRPSEPVRPSAREAGFYLEKGIGLADEVLLLQTSDSTKSCRPVRFHRKGGDVRLEPVGASLRSEPRITAFSVVDDLYWPTRLRPRGARDEGWRYVVSFEDEEVHVDWELEPIVKLARVRFRDGSTEEPVAGVRVWVQMHEDGDRHPHIAMTNDRGEILLALTRACVDREHLELEFAAPGATYRPGSFELSLTASSEEIEYEHRLARESSLWEAPACIRFRVSDAGSPKPYANLLVQQGDRVLRGMTNKEGLVLFPLSRSDSAIAHLEVAPSSKVTIGTDVLLEHLSKPVPLEMYFEGGRRVLALEGTRPRPAKKPQSSHLFLKVTDGDDKVIPSTTVRVVGPSGPMRIKPSRLKDYSVNLTDVSKLHVEIEAEGYESVRLEGHEFPAWKRETGGYKVIRLEKILRFDGGITVEFVEAGTGSPLPEMGGQLVELRQGDEELRSARVEPGGGYASMKDLEIDPRLGDLTVAIVEGAFAENPPHLVEAASVRTWIDDDVRWATVRVEVQRAGRGLMLLLSTSSSWSEYPKAASSVRDGLLFLQTWLREGGAEKLTEVGFGFVPGDEQQSRILSVEDLDLEATHPLKALFPVLNDVPSVSGLGTGNLAAREISAVLDLQSSSLRRASEWDLVVLSHPSQFAQGGMEELKGRLRDHRIRLHMVEDWSPPQPEDEATSASWRKLCEGVGGRFTRAESPEDERGLKELLEQILPSK